MQLDTSIFSDIFSGNYAALGLAGALVLCLAALLGNRFWRLRNNKLSVPKLPPRRTPSITQIAVLLGILGYAVTAQFLGKGIESWFEIRVEKTLDARFAPGASGSLKELASIALDAKVAQEATALTAREDSGALSLSGNPSNQSAPTELAQTEPVPTGSAPDKLAIDTRVAQPAASLTAGEDSGAFPSYGALGLAGVLALGLAAVFGYRFWRSRNRSRQVAPKLTPRRTPSFALIAVLLCVLAYAVTMQFLDKGIGSWFDARVEKPLDDSPDNRLKELTRKPQALDEQVVRQAAPSSERDCGPGLGPKCQAETRPEPAETVRPGTVEVALADGQSGLKELDKETPTPDKRLAKRATPSPAKENVNAFSSADNARLPDKPVAGKLAAERVAQKTAPLPAKRAVNAFSPTDNVRLADKPVADKLGADEPVPDKRVAQQAAPLTAKESPSAFSSADNVSLPDKPGGDLPQQAAGRVEPVYRSSRPAKKREGKYAFNGSVGVESENAQYSTPGAKQDRQRLKTRLDLNNRGFIWDPRFITYSAGITLQKDAVRTTATSATGETDANNASKSKYNMLGYHINTTWFANKPHALNLYANRSQTTVSDYRTPTYGLVSTNMGARGSWEDKRAGRMNFYLNGMQADSDSSFSPRTDRNHSLGVDATKKLFPKQWGESDVTYGYRRSEMNEQVAGNKQSQDYLYLNDYSKLGDKMNLRADLTYSNHRSQYGSAAAGAASGGFASSFFGFNSGLTVRQSEKLNHSYNLGLVMSETGTSKTLGQNVSGAATYRFNNQWQTNGSLGLSSTKADSIGNQSQTNSTTTGSGGVQYSDKFDVYLINGGYNLSWSRSDSSQANAIVQQSAMQSANIGYTRTGSPRYTDSMQLRTSQTTGSSKSDEANVRYSVNSMLSPRDALQGSVDYRTYKQSYTILSGTGDSVPYSSASTNTRADAGWQHRFSDAASMIVSLGANHAVNNGLAYNNSYAQASVAMLFRGNLQWNALARREEFEGTPTTSGKKLTVESNLNYRFGKWQAGARYRFSDTRLQLNPFKEQSLFLTLTRAYDFNF